MPPGDADFWDMGSFTVIARMNAISALFQIDVVATVAAAARPTIQPLG
jgi:hypothetical protein